MGVNLFLMLRGINAHAENLNDCYHLALQQSEQIAIQEEAIVQARLHFEQILRGLLPEANFIYSQKIQDGSGRNNFSLGEVPEARFSFTQTLFRGFQELNLLKSVRHEKEQFNLALRRAKELLFQDVANAFYLQLTYQEDLDALETVRVALNQRVEELTKRESLGKARASELAGAQARLSQVEADMETQKGKLTEARQLLHFLTGKPIEFLIEDEPFDFGMTYASASEIDAGLRADVLAADKAIERVRKAVSVERLKALPTVELNGNYFTKRVGNADDVDWDMTLEFSMPLMWIPKSGAMVKEKNSLVRQAELQYALARRSAQLEVENAWTRFQSSQQRLQALTKALTATEKSHDLLLNDYDLNLVDNLIILEAIQDLQDVRRAVVATKNETRRLYWALRVAAGDLTDVDF